MPALADRNVCPLCVFRRLAGTDGEQFSPVESCHSSQFIGPERLAARAATIPGPNCSPPGRESWGGGDKFSVLRRKSLARRDLPSICARRKNGLLAFGCPARRRSLLGFEFIELSKSRCRFGVGNRIAVRAAGQSYTKVHYVSREPQHLVVRAGATYYALWLPPISCFA